MVNGGIPLTDTAASLDGNTEHHHPSTQAPTTVPKIKISMSKPTLSNNHNNVHEDTSKYLLLY